MARFGKPLQALLRRITADTRRSSPSHHLPSLPRRPLLYRNTITAPPLFAPFFSSSVATRGLYHHLVHEILDNSVGESQAGYASTINVVLYPDGSIPIDLHPETQNSVLESDLTVLHSGYSGSGGFNGVGLSVVTTLPEAILPMRGNRRGSNVFGCDLQFHRHCHSRASFSPTQYEDEIIRMEDLKQFSSGLSLFVEMGTKFPRQSDEIYRVGLRCCKRDLHGRMLHARLVKFGRHNLPKNIGNLIDMYSGVGRLDWAVRAFNSVDASSLTKNMGNAMISAYGYHGFSRESMQVFQQMWKKGITLDKGVYNRLLIALVNCGRHEECYFYYKLLLSSPGVEVTAEHHLAMLRMLCKESRFEAALDLIKAQPLLINEPRAWEHLASAAKNMDLVDVGFAAVKKLLELKKDDQEYIFRLVRMLETAGRFNEACELRQGLVKKQPGLSWVEGPESG